MIVTQNNALAARVAGSWLDAKFAEPMIGLIVMDGQRPAGAVILNNYSGRNIDLTALGVGCWPVKVIRELARYVFVQLKCRRVTAMTRVSNTRARRALEALGFECEGRCPDWFDDGETALRFCLTASRQRIFKW